MKPSFLPEITYMRGLCMLGVIGIHVGSIALINPQANLQLLAVLEILSRFCVPAFFFLSAFGLFYHSSVFDEFSFSKFLKKRIKVVVLPYLIWSIFYLAYMGFTSHNFTAFKPQLLLPTIFFGNAMYHLYFMVILIWFYLFMPLWRWLVRLILPHAKIWLTIIFGFQTLLNYWSSYLAGHIIFSNPAIQYAFSMRLNYWIILYIWIFLLGAVFAEKYETLRSNLWNYRYLIIGFFLFTVTFMLGSYYYVLDVWHYTRLEVIYTIHQLSPMGMLYTGGGTIFFLFAFIYSPLSTGVKAFWEQIGKNSYGIYLSHPLILIWLTALIDHLHLLYTAQIVIALYICTLCLTYLFTLLLSKLPKGIRKLILGS